MFDLTLTFDNGPEPETTPFVLDVLARRSIRTTFFLVGNEHVARTLIGATCARGGSLDRQPHLDPVGARSGFSRTPAPSVTKSAALRRRSARSLTRTAFSAHSGKEAIWMNGYSIR
jgi:peptidoglycan/xylan/chitin deacetylase (PgdA/CDA1 family)